MLAVELKRSISVVFAPALKSTIRDLHMVKDENSFIEELQTLDRLRQDALTCAPGSSECIKRLRHYYTQVVALPDRFPFDNPDDLLNVVKKNNLVEGKSIKLSFSWFPTATFVGPSDGQTAAISSYDLRYEAACILFNLGAAYSQQAASLISTSTSDAEGIRNACNDFISAATAFSRITRVYSLSACPPPAADLAEGSLEALSDLMLAQAQECCYLKAVCQGVKHGTIAKVAGGVASLYEKASRSSLFLENLNFPGSSPKDSFKILSAFKSGPQKKYSIPIQAYSRCKAGMYRTIAHQKKAAELLSSGSYGKEIAKLNDAISTARQTLDYLVNLDSPISSNRHIVLINDSLKRLLDASQKDLSRALNDNRLIYSETVPASSAGQAWGDCGCAILTSIPDAKTLASDYGSFPQEFPPLFQRLPFIARSVLTSSLMRILNGVFCEQDERSRKLLDQLEAASLDEVIIESRSASNPKTLVEEPVPNEVLSASKKIKDIGGLSKTTDLMGERDELRKIVLSSVTNSVSRLDAEQVADTEARNRFGPRWTFPASKNLSTLMWSRIEEIRKLLKTASDADLYTDNLYEQHLPMLIALVDEDPSALSRTIPTLSAPSCYPTKNLENLNFDAELDRLFQVQQSIRSSIEEFDNNLKQALDSINVSEFESAEDLTSALDALTSESLSEIFPIIQQQVDECSRAFSRLSTDIKAQRLTVASINLNQKKIDVDSERKKIIDDLLLAANAYERIVNRLDEGIIFYQTIKEQVESLIIMCDDFVRSRDDERGDLLASLKQTFSHLSNPPQNNYYPTSIANHPPSNPKYSDYEERSQINTDHQEFNERNMGHHHQRQQNLISGPRSINHDRGNLAGSTTFYSNQPSSPETFNTKRPDFNNELNAPLSNATQTTHSSDGAIHHGQSGWNPNMGVKYTQNHQFEGQVSNQNYHADARLRNQFDNQGYQQLDGRSQNQFNDYHGFHDGRISKSQHDHQGHPLSSRSGTSFENQLNNQNHSHQNYTSSTNHYKPPVSFNDSHNNNNIKFGDGRGGNHGTTDSGYPGASTRQHP